MIYFAHGLGSEHRNPLDFSLLLAAHAFVRVVMPSASRMTCRVETKGKEMLKGKLSLLLQKPDQCEATISEQIESVLRFSDSFGMVVYQSFHLFFFGLLWANI
jgi:hypothetical protein